MQRSLLLACAFIVVCGSSLTAQDSPLVAAARSVQRRQPFAPISSRAPDVRTIRWFNTNATSLAAFRGRVILVSFWATWCASCPAAYPEIKHLVSQLGPSGFTPVLIHARYTRTPGPNTQDVIAESLLPTYIQEHKLSMPVAIAAADEFESLGIKGIPHYVLIDRRGFVRYSRAGRLPDAATISVLLREPVLVER